MGTVHLERVREERELHGEQHWSVPTLNRPDAAPDPQRRHHPPREHRDHRPAHLGCAWAPGPSDPEAVEGALVDVQFLTDRRSLYVLCGARLRVPRGFWGRPDHWAPALAGLLGSSAVTLSTARWSMSRFSPPAGACTSCGGPAPRSRAGSGVVRILGPCTWGAPAPRALGPRGSLKPSTAPAEVQFLTDRRSLYSCAGPPPGPARVLGSSGPLGSCACGAAGVLGGDAVDSALVDVCTCGAALAPERPSGAPARWARRAAPRPPGGPGPPEPQGPVGRRQRDGRRPVPPLPPQPARGPSSRPARTSGTRAGPPGPRPSGPLRLGRTSCAVTTPRPAPAPRQPFPRGTPTGTATPPSAEPTPPRPPRARRLPPVTRPAEAAEQRRVRDRHAALQGPRPTGHHVVFRRHRPNGRTKGGGLAPDRVHTIG